VQVNVTIEGPDGALLDQVGWQLELEISPADQWEQEIHLQVSYDGPAPVDARIRVEAEVPAEQDPYCPPTEPATPPYCADSASANVVPRHRSSPGST
jgi:hypothetical protein